MGTNYVFFIRMCFFHVLVCYFIINLICLATLCSQVDILQRKAKTDFTGLFLKFRVEVDMVTFCFYVDIAFRLYLASSELMVKLFGLNMLLI